MRRIAIVIIAIIIVSAFIIPPPPVAAQSCVALGHSSGWRSITVNTPSWSNQFRVDVEWSGLQLRVRVDGIVGGTDMYGDGSWRSVYTYPIFPGGRAYVVELGGIAVDRIGQWTVYACGNPPPTPTPIPTPTPEPPAFGPGCVSRVGERPVWVGEGRDPELTLYGPTAGWWIVAVRQDPGGSGAQYVGWRATTSTGVVLAERMVDGEFEVRAGMIVTITPYRTPLTSDGLVGVWVTITSVCTGLVPTPLAPGPDDIRPVEFGIEEASEPVCVIEIPMVSVTFSPPLIDPFNLTFAGVRVCFVQKWLVMRWGDFNLVDWAIPILTLGFVWSAWLSIRRG